MQRQRSLSVHSKSIDNDLNTSLGPPAFTALKADTNDAQSLCNFEFDKRFSRTYQQKMETAENDSEANAELKLDCTENKGSCRKGHNSRRNQR